MEHRAHAEFRISALDGALSSESTLSSVLRWLVWDGALILEGTLSSGVQVFESVHGAQGTS